MSHSTSILLALFIGGLIMMSLLLIFYLIFIRNESKTRNLLLASLFLAVALRISKSSMFFLFGDVNILIRGLGFLGLALIAPISFIYFKNSTLEKPKLVLSDTIHFIFPIAGFILYFQYGENSVMSFYYLATIVLFIYLVVVNYILFKSKRHEGDKNSLRFNYSLLIGLYGLCALFIMQHLSQSYNGYLLGVILATILIYSMFFYILKTKIIIPKRKISNLSEKLISKVREALEEDKLYRNSDIKLNSFSESIDEPTYMVSKAVKLIYNKNFPEIVNTLRVNEIKRRLEKDSNSKIEDLAFDTGFNSISSFYYAFKKETSISPRTYQNNFFKTESDK